MTGTFNNNSYSWVKEQTDIFESITATKLDFLDELTNHHLRWFSKCTTISQLLAWGKNNHYPTESKASKKEDVSNVESTNSMISTENVPVTDISPNKPMIEEDNRTTPDEFIEALASIENLTSKSMIEEDSETVADDFIETLVSNEILAIAEEREIQLAPEFHSILNYDPKEAEYVRSTPELLRDVDTQSQSQHSFTTPEQIDNSKDDDEILLFVSSRKSGKHSTKSPIRRATNQYIIVSPSQSSPIRSVNRYIPSSPSKTVTTQHIATSPAQTSRSIPSPNSSPVRSVNKYIPVSKSRASATQTPIRTKPGKTGTIINAKYQHQSISPVKTAAIKKPVRIIPIKQKIVKDPKIANRVKAAYVKTASTKNPIETNSIKTAKKETIVTGLVKKLSNQHKTKSPIQTGPNTGDTMACPSVSTLLNYQDSNTESADWASNVCMSSGVYNINNNYTVESSDHKKRHLESVPKMVQTIEVSEIMPQKPYRKKLRLANPKKITPKEPEEIKKIEKQQEQEKEPLRPKFTVPSWATEPELFEHMRNQESMDPDSIFGPFPPLDLNEIFNRPTR